MSLKGNRLAQDELYRIFVYSQDEIIGKEAKELGTEALYNKSLGILIRTVSMTKICMKLCCSV